MDTIDLQDTDATPIDAAPTPGKQHKRRWWRRKDRKGLGTVEITMIILAIVIVGLLGTLGLTRVISARSGAEHSAVKSNIDTVSGFVDTYWTSYSADEDGRRKLTIWKLCHYVNSQIAGGNINFRTLQLSDATGGQAAVVALSPALAGGGDGSTAGTGVGFAVRNSATGTEATCPATAADLDHTYGDIAFATAVNIDLTLATGAEVQGTAADYDLGTADGTGTLTPEDVQEALEAADLLSTNTVWMAMYGTEGDTAGTDGFDLHGNLPGGTDGYWDTDLDDDSGVEYIVLGGQAPDGTSFCEIKVLDAAVADEIGSYYVARTPADGDDPHHFATCLQGVDGAFPNDPRHRAWGEAQ